MGRAEKRTYEQIYEGNKKNILNSNFTSQNTKIAPQSQKNFLPLVGYKPRFGQEIIAKLLCDNNLNAAPLAVPVKKSLCKGENLSSLTILSGSTEVSC